MTQQSEAIHRSFTRRKNTGKTVWEQILLELDRGRTPAEIAKKLGCGRNYVYKVKYDVPETHAESIDMAPFMAADLGEEDFRINLTGREQERYNQCRQFREYCVTTGVIWTDSRFFRYLASISPLDAEETPQLTAGRNAGFKKRKSAKREKEKENEKD